MFRKILIANRGEIAVRIITTCRDMGVHTVAVYSDADADALHVQRADESYRVGPPPALESYLNIPAVIRAAVESGAEAVHPGYGFLSENPEFARACGEAGIVFIGPSPEAMRLLGSKQAAKQLAREVGVPVVPGYDGAEQDLETLARHAEEIDFPLLIKASAGGGGKGMRVVRSAAGFLEALEGAKREARSAFGDDTVLLERYIDSPRHIEFQVLADTLGNVVHLGERECSIQRRHQKVIEESPSAVIAPELRAKMGEAAKQLVAAAGYTNAGTVEFILAPSGEYYFLEVNTRLQVEHPVTEMVTGLDLVREQLRIAAGLPVSVTQAEVELRGHAIECRVYAEDPERGFLPSTGKLTLFSPPLGTGIRNDVGVETGNVVTPYYDPMLAKLITYDENRAECVGRTLEALDRYEVRGVRTNLDLLRRLVDSPSFRTAQFSTTFLDQRLAELIAAPPLPEDALLAAAASQLAPRPAPNPWEASPWRNSAQPVELRYIYGGQPLVVRAVAATLGEWRVTTPEGERTVAVERAGPDEVLIRQGARARTALVEEADDELRVRVDGAMYTLAEAGPPKVGRAGQAGGAGQEQLEAPMPGTVVKVNVEAGEHVDAGQTLVVMEAMKMEHSIAAPHAGTVRRVNVSAGDLVQAGTLLVEVE